MNNLEKFKELIELYESITIKDLAEIAEELGIDSGYKILNNLTGFGNCHTCTLCKAVNQDVVNNMQEGKPNNYNCKNCVYGKVYNIKDGVHFPCLESDTYNNIIEAKSLVELLETIKARATYMKIILTKLENK